VTHDGGAKDGGEPETPVVLVVDDDPLLRDALRRLLGSVGLRVETYPSAAAFLQVEMPTGPTCLVLDIRMPGQSGLELQAELVKEDIHLPIVFITGHGDVATAAKALKAGAVDFLPKPFREQDLLDAVTSALDRARQHRDAERRLSDLRTSFEALTPRERQIMRYVADGFMNKEIAVELGLAQMTVKIHRGNMMRKMGAGSLVELVRMADDLGLSAAQRGT